MSGGEGTPDGRIGETTTPRGVWPDGSPSAGNRPVGPPPAGPPQAQPPTALPPQWSPGPQGGPPAGPPAGPPVAQPGWGYGGGQPPYGQPPLGSFGQPPRKRRWPLFVGIGVVLLLVVGLGVTGWFYFTGRFGIGPLSAADKDAAATIGKEVGVPTWADDDQIDCATDELIHESRSGELEKRGLIERDGDDWSYTGEWDGADATSYFEKLLDCSDDWAEQVGKEWKLSDTDCLEDIGTETVGAWFATELLTISEGDESAKKDREAAVKELDECYAKAPAAPVATAKPAYRAVNFTFTPPDAAAGDVVINTGGAGNWKPISGSAVEVDAEEGGKRVCVDAQAVATFAWGTTTETAAQFCGVSQAKRIWWERLPTCTAAAGCKSWRLHYEGFRDFQSITARYTSNGGDCMAVSGRCSDTVSAAPGGRGTVVTWSFPGSYTGRFVAQVGSLKARIK